MKGENPTDLSKHDDSAINYIKPKSFIDAVSEIQRLYVMEKDNDKDIDTNFFALAQVIDFLWVGFKNGFIESFIFVTLLPFLHVIYPSFSYHFLDKQLTDTQLLILNLGVYIPLVIITVYLSYLGRFNQTVIARKALVSLVSGRSIGFMIKGFIVYFVFLWIYEISKTNPNYIYNALDFIKFIIDLLPFDRTYFTQDLYTYFYKYVAPALEETAINALTSMAIFALIPYFVIVIRGAYLNYKKIYNEVQYDEY